jgi:hypothetical protein
MSEKRAADTNAVIASKKARRSDHLALLQAGNARARSLNNKVNKATQPARGRPLRAVPTTAPADVSVEPPFSREQGARLQKENDDLREQLGTARAGNANLKSRLQKFTQAFQWPHNERSTWFNVGKDTRGAMGDAVVRMILLMW